MFSNINKLLSRILSMHEFAWMVFTRSLILSCVLLFCAFVLLIDIQHISTQNYDTYFTAKTLIEIPQLVLLFGTLGSACIEDYLT